MEEALIEHSGVGETVTLPYDLEASADGGCNGHRAGPAGAEPAAAEQSGAPHTGDGPPAAGTTPGPAPGAVTAARAASAGNLSFSLCEILSCAFSAAARCGCQLVLPLCCASPHELVAHFP